MKRHLVVIVLCSVLISIAFADANGTTQPPCFIGQNLTFEGKPVEIKIPNELPDFTLFLMRCAWYGERLQLLRFYQQTYIRETAEFVANTYELFVFKNRPEVVALIFREQIWIYEDNSPVPATKEELKSRLKLYSEEYSKI
jgi:hypothetical protein